MSAEAEWSELPKELLNLISERIDNEIDLIHFRSVCSSWRSSSSIPNHRINTLPFKLPLLGYYGDNKVSDPLCYLSKRIIFLIKPSPQQDQTLVRPWLIRVTQNPSGKTKLYKSPLFKFELPSLFPFSIDLINTSVLNLGTDFIVDEPLHYGYMYPTKVVAVTPLILAILLTNGHLALLRCGDERWTVVPEIPLYIQDICVFKGQIYAVEALTRKTVTVGPEDLSVRLVAEDVHRGLQDIQFLVESEGELLLVDVYESLFSFELVTIYVFRLDEKETEWVELTSLGDRILFWGNGCSFSASASDLSVAKGNCVIFIDDVIDYNKICDSGMCVFDLNRGRLLPLSDYPDYLNMFWPPPKSIVKSCIPKTKKSMLSCIKRFLM
ncbi:F-box protein SKIP23 [Trifolium repens]|nr:F-box protein SKIP23 [Trifolium repens]